MTSLYEGEAVVVMEAFASGLLVAGTKVGLLADVLENGVTVNPGDAEGLAEKVVQLLGDPVKAKQLRRSNLDFATRHSAEWTFNQYQNLFSCYSGSHSCRDTMDGGETIPVDHSFRKVVCAARDI